ELTGILVTKWPCKPYPKATPDSKAYAPCSFQEVARAIRQLIVEIDRRLIQNPAYGLLVLNKKITENIFWDILCFFVLLHP
ncbi:MAG: hypothetical protein RR846_10565, partial [Oscillospiraceae bacterium]